jgi:hypothetical protein
MVYSPKDIGGKWRSVFRVDGRCAIRFPFAEEINYRALSYWLSMMRSANFTTSSAIGRKATRFCGRRRATFCFARSPDDKARALAGRPGREGEGGLDT